MPPAHENGSCAGETPRLCGFSVVFTLAFAVRYRYARAQFINEQTGLSAMPRFELGNAAGRFALTTR
jgi:hypothetical protein